MTLRRRQLLASAVFALASPAGAQEKSSITLVGATLWRPGEPPLENATLTLAEGKIAALGGPPAGEVIDVSGKIVTAGLVDLLTQIGVVEVDLEPSTNDREHEALEDPDPVRAAFLTADGYNPQSTVVAVARQGGLTSAGVIPQQGLVSGQSAWVDLAGDRADDAIVRRSLALHVILSDASFGGFGRARGTALLRLRELFDDARAYRTQRAGYDRRQVRELSASRLDLEAVVAALEGRLPFVMHVDRASDILTALRLARDNGLRLVLASAAEGWRVAGEIATAAVPVIVYPLDHGPRTFAALGAREDNAARLAAAGVTIALSTGESHNARKLRQVAGNAVRAGLSPSAALAAVSETPARIMGLPGYGTPAAGRVANLVVWSGDPFELSSRVERMFIRGKEASLRSRQTALFERYR
jgi:imidazolonepropionase-like amidohydrolase